jgi:hypothetical protein
MRGYPRVNLFVSYVFTYSIAEARLTHPVPSGVPGEVATEVSLADRLSFSTLKLTLVPLDTTWRMWIEISVGWLIKAKS